MGTRTRNYNRHTWADVIQALELDREDVRPEPAFVAVMQLQDERNQWRSLAGQFRQEADNWRVLAEIIRPSDPESAGLYDPDAITIPSLPELETP